MPETETTYLGDGVYAYSDGDQIWIWTERGCERHEIALEPAVLEALNAYDRRLREAAAAPTKE